MLFMERLNEDYRRMRADPEVWDEFVREQNEWLLGVPYLRDEYEPPKDPFPADESQTVGFEPPAGHRENS